MKPPHWLCEECNFIIIGSGSQPHECPRCHGHNFRYLGYEDEYDSKRFQSPLIQVPIAPNQIEDSICPRCGYIYTDLPIYPSSCLECGEKKLIMIGYKGNYDLNQIQKQYPTHLEFRRMSLENIFKKIKK
jgi:rubrerythrin